MKVIIMLLLAVAAGYFWFEDTCNRRELEEAKAQITKLIMERDMAIQKLKGNNLSSPQASVSHPPDWFQKRLNVKSALISTNISTQLGNHK